MAWSLAGAALLLAQGQGLATAATITVTTNDKERPGPDKEGWMLWIIKSAKTPG
jgi:hypothetical protein